ncbi:hypothetical protein ACXYMT_03245 [Salinimicrobium sp. CAU 1759]
MDLLSPARLSILLMAILVPDLSKFSSEQDESHLIRGTWMIKDEPENLWSFTSTECHWIIDGKTSRKFNYKISRETSPSGLEHHYLDLFPLNQKDTLVSHSYAINSLGSDKMTLEVMEPKLSYIHFVRLRTTGKD